MTDQNDEEKIAEIVLGIGVFPVITTNFVTDKEGGNEVVDNIQHMYSQIMDETVAKLHAACGMYCVMQGVTLVKMDNEEMKKHIKFMLNEQPDNTDVHGVYNRDTGEYIIDPDFISHIASGRRSDS